MGYRSEIVFAVAPQAVPAFMTLCAKFPSVQKLCFNDRDKLQSEDGEYLFHWEHIKWYHSFEEIEALDSFMTALESGDISEYGEHGEEEWVECFKFVRIGEDRDDTEERGYGFDDIQLNRSISF